MNSIGSNEPMLEGSRNEEGDERSPLVSWCQQGAVSVCSPWQGGGHHWRPSPWTVVLLAETKKKIWIRGGPRSLYFLATPSLPTRPVHIRHSHCNPQLYPIRVTTPNLSNLPCPLLLCSALLIAYLLYVASLLPARQGRGK